MAQGEGLLRPKQLVSIAGSEIKQSHRHEHASDSIGEYRRSVGILKRSRKGGLELGNVISEQNFDFNLNHQF